METFKSEIMGNLLESSLKTSSVYECKTGKLVEVPEATEAGKAG
jgi:hypothetical protein